MPMKVTLVINSLGPGGAERVLTILAGGIAAAGHDVTLVTMVDASTDFYAVDARVRRVGFGFSRPSRSAIEGVILKARVILRIRRFLRRRRPDVVLSFIDTMNVVVLVATIGMRLPVVVSERIDPRQQEVEDTVARLLRPYMYRRARMVVMQTKSAAQWAVDAVGANKVIVLPNPIAAEFRPRDEPPLGDNGRTFVAVGRLARQKGFDMLITAFAQIARDIPGWSLWILGEGVERPSLMELASGLGVGSRVHLIGNTRDPSIHLRSADVFVLSSRYEGFPNALLEALAVGVPVISFACPSGPDEIITHNVSGVLVAPGSVSALAHAMLDLAHDSQKRERLARGAVEAAKGFRADVVCATWEALLTRWNAQ
jgi:GalNAc-alpha-(1->4)-GalNAc-alpha-(1->3)-diNAcBac-PP-undecaprenol alpha-1,4-N-acetyl-D-galactosaminyltransferase